MAEKSCGSLAGSRDVQLLAGWSADGAGFFGAVLSPSILAAEGLARAGDPDERGVLEGHGQIQ